MVTARDIPHYNVLLVPGVAPLLFEERYVEESGLLGVTLHEVEQLLAREQVVPLNAVRTLL